MINLQSYCLFDVIKYKHWWHPLGAFFFHLIYSFSWKNSHSCCWSSMPNSESGDIPGKIKLKWRLTYRFQLGYFWITKFNDGFYKLSSLQWMSLSSSLIVSFSCVWSKAAPILLLNQIPISTKKYSTHGDCRQFSRILIKMKYHAFHDILYTLGRPRNTGINCH